MSEFYFDTPTGDVLLGVGATALRFAVTDAGVFTDMLRHDVPKSAAPANPADIPQQLVPLHTIILQPEDFPLKVGDYERPGPYEWDETVWLRFGKWALRVLDADEDRHENPTLLRQDIDRFRALGLCASYKSVYYRFRTMPAYRRALELPEGKVSHTYDTWSIGDFTAYARRVSRSLKKRAGHSGRPGEGDYEAWPRRQNCTGPSTRIIRARIGSISALNELIGYPDIKSWDDDDYFAWGARVLEANPGLNLTKTVIAALSKRDRGPSVKCVAKRFGITNFQKKVTERQDLQQAEAVRRAELWGKEYDRLLRQRAVTTSPEELPTPEKARIAMRYKIALSCMPTAPPKTLDSIARSKVGLTGDLGKRSNYTVQAADIEMKAISLDVFDTLFPVQRQFSDLYITSEELAATRAVLRGAPL